MATEIKKSVIFISGSHVWSMGPGRGASSFYRTIQHYHDTGWHVTLITNNDTSGLNLEKLQIIRIGHHHLSRWMAIPKLGQIFKILQYVIFTIRAVLVVLVMRPKIDLKSTIIYAYEIQGVAATYILSRILRAPTIHRFQGTVLKPLMGLPFWKVRFWDHYLGLSLPATLTIMTDDGTMGDEVLNHLCPNQRYEFWRNGVNLNYPPHKWYSDDGVRPDAPPQLLAVSRLVEWKRVDRLIHAIAKLSNRHPTVVLRILGDGPERTRLQDLARELDVEERIIFVGAVPQAEVVEFMTASDIFLSVYSLSNLGNPLFEALSVGLPIITINNGSTSRVIEHDVNGILLDDDSVEAISDAINTLIGDVDMRYRLARGAKIYANRNFVSWARRLEKEELIVRGFLDV